jgi:hypothetical protein
MRTVNTDRTIGIIEIEILVFVITEKAAAATILDDDPSDLC